MIKNKTKKRVKWGLWRWETRNQNPKEVKKWQGKDDFSQSGVIYLFCGSSTCKNIKRRKKGAVVWNLNSQLLQKRWFILVLFLVVDDLYILGSVVCCVKIIWAGVTVMGCACWSGESWLVFLKVWMISNLIIHVSADNNRNNDNKS